MKIYNFDPASYHDGMEMEESQLVVFSYNHFTARILKA